MLNFVQNMYETIVYDHTLWRNDYLTSPARFILRNVKFCRVHWVLGLKKLTLKNKNILKILIHAKCWPEHVGDHCI